MWKEGGTAVAGGASWCQSRPRRERPLTRAPERRDVSPPPFLHRARGGYLQLQHGP
jgi:hypothetical protein